MQIINLFAFLSVIFRAATIMVAVACPGRRGVVFSGLVLGHSGEEANPSEAKRACQRMLRSAAIILIMVQAPLHHVRSPATHRAKRIPNGRNRGSKFLPRRVPSIVSGLLIVFVPYSPNHSAWVLIPLALGVIAAMVATSHAASRLESRGVLICFTALHLVAVAWLDRRIALLAPLSACSPD
jgi:hypothetical protein